jgi:hypothetical protein
MEDAGDLESPNTISVMPVQVRFTAFAPGRKMGEHSQNSGTPQTQTDRSGYQFGYLSDLESCPPGNAVAREGLFYAFHDSNPPDAADFQTAAQRMAYLGKKEDECKRRSNSVWSDLNALRSRVQELQRRHPMRYRHISSGQINAKHGLLDCGNGPHHSFWVCRTTSMHQIFTGRTS